MKILRFNEEAYKAHEYESTPSILASAVERSQALIASGEPFLTNAPGKSFYIPLLIPANKPAGDNRKFKKFDLLPAPATLLWQPQLADKHDTAVVVGRIDSWEILEDGSVGHVHGVFDTGVWGKEAQRLVENNYLRGVSADMDCAEQDEEDEDVFTSVRVTGATIVAKPAFQEATVSVVSDFSPVVEDIQLDMDGVFEETDMQDESAVLLASAAPMYPPESWLQNPKLTEPTALTITDDGQVYGHIATWNTNHIGMHGRIKPPHSKNNYKFFRTGMLRTEEGTDVPVGQITLVGGHADPYLSASQAVAHYDSTESAICDVAAGEDRFGIWVAGALRPDITETQIRSLRAAAPSGDWRPIGGRLELVAICQVNVPGFPTPRVVTASGAVMALCAAGTSDLLELYSNPLEDRVEALEEVLNKEKVDTALREIEELAVADALSAIYML